MYKRLLTVIGEEKLLIFNYFSGTTDGQHYPVVNMLQPSGSPRVPDDETVTDVSVTRGPYFDKSASKNVTALVGKTAYLNCRVRNLGNRSVSHETI